MTSHAAKAATAILAKSPRPNSSRKSGKSAGRRRGAEEVDEEFDGTVDRRLGAEHDTDGNAGDDGDQDRIGDADDGVEEIAGHLAGGDIRAGVAQRLERRRQEVLVDELALEGDPPQDDEQRGPDRQLSATPQLRALEYVRDQPHVTRSRKIAVIFRRPIIVGLGTCKRNAQLCNAPCRFTYSSRSRAMIN